MYIFWKTTRGNPVESEMAFSGIRVNPQEQRVDEHRLLYAEVPYFPFEIE